MYESSGSQLFRIQSGPDTFDESRFIMTFLTILGVTEILWEKTSTKHLKHVFLWVDPCLFKSCLLNWSKIKVYPRKNNIHIFWTAHIFEHDSREKRTNSGNYMLWLQLGSIMKTELGSTKVDLDSYFQASLIICIYTVQVFLYFWWNFVPI